MGHYAVDNPAWWITTHDIIYTFHMPLFLFASGFIYIAFKKNERYGSFLLKKVKRLLVPYYVTSIIVVSIKILTQSFLYVENPVTLSSYIKILYLPEAGFFLWFIWVLWWLFCIVPLFYTRMSRTVLFFFFFLLHYASPYIDLPEIFCIKELANGAIWFMLGVMCYDWKAVLDNVKGNQVCITLILFLMIIVLPNACDLTDLVVVNRWRQLIYMLQPYIGIVFIMCIAKWLSQHSVPQVILTLSLSSYMIYLFHTTFMGFTKALLMKIPLMGEVPVLSIIIVVLSGVVFPIVLSNFFERYRLTRFLFGIR